MDYIIRDIAEITPPRRVTLAALPNFIQIASKPRTGEYYAATITPLSPSAVSVTVADNVGGARTFIGTLDPQRVGGQVFYLSADPLETAENLRAAMLADDWLAANYEIYTPLAWAGGGVTSTGVEIRSRGQGSAFNLNITAVGAMVNGVTPSSSSDSLKGNEPTADIYADIYAVDADHVGEFDRPAGRALGRRLVTLAKTYAGDPVWFDLNGIAAGAGPWNAPPEVPGWFDAGTAQPYRAELIRGGYNRTPFYLSDVLWIVDGYGRLSADELAGAYVYDGDVIRLLTGRPVTPYVRGQREYLNFILEDPYKGTALDPFTVSVVYKAFDGTGEYLGAIQAHTQARETFHVVNSCVLDLDAVLDANPTAARVAVSLQRDGVTISNDQVYEIRRECLVKPVTFSFINRLGGWDAVTFDGSEAYEIRTEADTYRRTVTPAYDKAHGVEAVHVTRLGETVTVSAAPVSRAVAEWLAELAAARVILDSAGRRIVLDEFTLKIAPGNMHTPAMKYHYSDTYTNEG